MGLNWIFWRLEPEMDRNPETSLRNNRHFNVDVTTDFSAEQRPGKDLKRKWETSDSDVKCRLFCQALNTLPLFPFRTINLDDQFETYFRILADKSSSGKSLSLGRLFHWIPVRHN